jgi:hypothetical protein
MWRAVCEPPTPIPAFPHPSRRRFAPPQDEVGKEITA